MAPLTHSGVHSPALAQVGEPYTDHGLGQTGVGVEGTVSDEAPFRAPAGATSSRTPAGATSGFRLIERQPHDRGIFYGGRSLIEGRRNRLRRA